MNRQVQTQTELLKVELTDRQRNSSVTVKRDKRVSVYRLPLVLIQDPTTVLRYPRCQQPAGVEHSQRQESVNSGVTPPQTD